VLRPRGFKALLHKNIARLWIDVSEGGLRAVVQGRAAIGEILHGKLDHPELHEKIVFDGVVRHARKSDKYPDCTLIGLRFEEPSSLLVAFIRDILGREPGMMSLNPPTPKPRPPS